MDLGDGLGVFFSSCGLYTCLYYGVRQAALLSDEFAKRNVKVLAVSIDPHDNHEGWVKDINETQYCYVNFPVIAGEDTGYQIIKKERSIDEKFSDFPNRKLILIEQKGRYIKAVLQVSYFGIRIEISEILFLIFL